MGVKVGILAAQTHCVIFIDALCVWLHIFRQTTHQNLTSPKTRILIMTKIACFLALFKDWDTIVHVTIEIKIWKYAEQYYVLIYAIYEITP